MITIDEVKNTALIIDYLKTNFIPDLDVLLDWRNRLIELKEMDKKNNMYQDMYDLEVKAVDYLIQEHYS